MDGEPIQTNASKGIQIAGGIHFRKVNGQLQMVRKRRESAIDVGLDLLGEVFSVLPQMRMRNQKHNQSPTKTKDDKDTEEEDIEIEVIMDSRSQSQSPAPDSQPVPQIPQQTQQQFQSSMSGPPKAGIYERDGRQLILMPKRAMQEMQGAMMGAGRGSPYSQGPYGMFSRGQYGGGMPFPPWGGYGPPWTTGLSQRTIEFIPPIPEKPVCAGCGNVRSRRYQARNPVKHGEPHPVSFCRKCEREATTDEDSDEEMKEEAKRKGDSKGKKAKSQKKGKKESLDEDTSELLSASKQRDDVEDYTFINKSGRGRRPDVEPVLHSKGRVSERVDEIEESPRPEDRRRGRARSIDSISQREREDSPYRTVFVERDSGVRYVLAGDQASRQSSRYDYSGAEEEHRGRDAQARAHGGYRSTAGRDPPRRSSIDAYQRRRYQPSNGSYDGSMAILEKSQQSSKRRRKERGTIPPRNANDDDFPQIVGTTDKDEFVVVTERYEYRRPSNKGTKPISSSRNLPADTRQQRIDATILQSDCRLLRFEDNKEAADYYRNDWEHGMPIAQKVRRRLRAEDLDGLPREQLMPLASDPLRAAGKERKVRKDSLSDEESLAYEQAKEAYERGRESRTEAAREEKPQQRSAGTIASSSRRPTYARGAVDEGMESSLFSSPRDSRGEFRGYLSPSVSEYESGSNREASRHLAYDSRDAASQDSWIDSS